MRLAVLLAVLLPSALGAQGVPGSGAVSPGPLYIVGGGPQSDAMVREFIALAGGPGRARIVVLAMASASGERSGEAKAEDLRALGAEAVNLWVTREEADTESTAARLVDATGIWFGGGDQNRLADVVRGTALERAIHARHAAGAVVGGTSAGAAVLSAVMITGDERRPGGTRPDTVNANLTIDRGNVVTAPGFGLAPDVIVDQHFVRRRRHNRLLSLVLEQSPHLGAGIDESTALVIEVDGTWRVSGESVVVVYDARAARRDAPPSGAPHSRPLSGADLRLHVLAPGDRFDPRRGVVHRP
jgi:cyanophycinase